MIDMLKETVKIECDSKNVNQAVIYMPPVVYAKYKDDFAPHKITSHQFLTNSDFKITSYFDIGNGYSIRIITSKSLNENEILISADTAYSNCYPPHKIIFEGDE